MKDKLLICLLALLTWLPPLASAQIQCAQPGSSACPAPGYGFVPSPHFGYCPTPWWGGSYSSSFGPGYGYSSSQTVIMDSYAPLSNCQSRPPENQPAARVLELAPYLSQPPKANPSDLQKPATPGSLNNVLTGVWPSSEPPCPPGAPGSETSSSSCLPAADKYQAIIADYTRALAASPDFAPYHFNRALALARLGRMQEALDDLDCAIAANSKEANYYLNRSSIHLTLGNYSKALADCSQALKLEPSSSRGLYKRALCHLKLKEPALALSDLNCALSLDPDSPHLYFLRAVASFDLGQLEPALNDYNQALRLDKDNRDALFGRAMLYFAIRQYRLAIESFDQFIALEGRDSRAFENRGLAYFQLAEYQKAADDYGRALAVSPDSWHIYYNRAIAYILLLNGAGAASDARKALSIAKWSNEAAPQLALLACLGYMQSGNNEARLSFLEETTANLKENTWPLPLFLFWQKKETEKQVLESALTARARTQAHACLGLSFNWSGQKAAGAPHLSWVKEFGSSDLLEYALARICLSGQAARTPVVASHPLKNKWAIVVGVSKFKDSSINLKYADQDARNFCNYLTAEGGFSKNHVKLLVNEDASRENILSELADRWLPRVCDPDDLVVVYFSGHGSPSALDQGGLNYLVAYNTDKTNLFATGLPVQDLTRLIKERVPARRVLVVLDACHSGAAEVESKGLTRNANFNADEMMRDGSQLVICSSEPSQLSWESKRYPSSVFTHHLIEGLKLKGRATRLGEAYSHTKQTTAQEVQMDRGQSQTPVMKSNWPGNDLILAAPEAESASR